MSRVVFSGALVVGALILLPLTIRGDGHDRPELAVSEACAQTGQCCYQLQSICLVDGQARLNMRSADGQPCPRPKPEG